MHRYLRLMRFDKPIGIYLLAYPVVWSLLLAGPADINIWLIFLLGVVVMRCAGCIINDYADRHIDGKVMRTHKRVLVTKEVSPQEALGILVVLLIIALILVLYTNMLTISLALVAGVLTMIYPFTKRFFAVPQLFLSIAFATSVPMTFAASMGYIPVGAWIVFVTTIIWVVTYDTMYALSDKADDLRIDVKSAAIYFGKLDKLIIGILQGCMSIGLILLGIWFELHIIYYISVVVGIGLMIYHQYLIKDRDRTLCLKAFLHNNYLGLWITLGIVTDLYIR